MNKNKVLSGLLALGLTTGATMAPAFAQEETPSVESTTNEKGGMVTKKTAKLEDDGTYTIDLEAYATGNTFQPDPEGVPLDVVLVIDQSGSMAGTKLSNLKVAVKTFLANLQANADEYNVDHRVSMIGYAGSASSTYDGQNFGHTNTRLLKDGTWKSYYYKSGWRNTATEGNLNDQDYQNAFHSIGSDYSKLVNAANELSASGATRTDLGMKMAENVFRNNPINSEDGRKRVTIVFTDGEPNGSSGFSESVANDAVNFSKTIKNEPYNSEVYTAGLFDSKPTSNSNVYKFLTRLGSASKDATKYNNGNLDPELTKKYYTIATDSNQLNSIFETIFHDMISGTEAKLNSGSVFRDIIGQGFDLPDKAIENGNITVSTVNGTRETNNSAVAWGSEQAADGSIQVSLNGKNVDVTGFDYKNEFIAPEHPGRKLKVKITGITPNDDAFNNNSVYTNGELSGVYEKADDAEPFIYFPSPKTLLTDKAYVVDYAKTISLNKSDWKMSEISKTTGAIKGTTDLNQKYGTFGTGLTSYTPNTTKWDGFDKNYVFGTAAAGTGEVSNGGKLWSRVSVLPANSVYYEDTFVTDEKAGVVGIEYAPGQWDSEGQTFADGYETDVVHGSWSDNSTANTDGTAHVADAANGVAKATFQFTGTGVDIYSRTNMKSGTIYVKVTNLEDKKIYNKGFVIDTKSKSGDYFSIPTFSLTDLPHGNYQVILQVTQGAKAEGRTKYAINGIRVYNPLDSGKTANGFDDAYTGEYNAQFKTVKNLINTGSTVFIDEPVNKDGSVIPGVFGNWELDPAPMNEVYLSNGQSVVMNVGNAAGEQFDKYYIGLKSPDGKEANVEISGGEGVTKTITPSKISSSMDLYFEVTPDADGNITISNTSPKGDDKNLISITKLRAANTVHKENATTYELAPLSDESAMNTFTKFKTAARMSETETPKVEDEFENEPSLTPDDSEEDTVTEIEEGNVEIENPEENVVESKPNNWWNKLFGGFGRLFR